MPNDDSSKPQEQPPVPPLHDPDKPWRRLYHGPEADTAQAQQAAPPAPEELSDKQERLLAWYRKTCLVAGAGLAGSAWHWRATTRERKREVFMPPRAKALPPEIIEAWKKKAEMREALRTIGRQSLFIAGVAGLYFGVELGVELWRQAPGDWANTAAAGAVAGGFLGARAPSSMRGRTLALGCTAGGLLGALSGWSQQQLARLAAAADGSGGSGSSGPPVQGQP